MNNIDFDDNKKFVEQNISEFHEKRIKAVSELTLNKLIQKNPYLLKAKNINTASELISGAIEAFLSSSEEKMFGDFLERLALFVAEKTCGGIKSACQGVDLEFDDNNIRYIISIKSGTQWGNSSQQDKLEEDFKKAVVRVKQQQKKGVNIQPVLGICYGKTKTSYVRGYLKVVGQNFWTLISGNQELYKDIIEPIGHKAKEFNDDFLNKKSKIINLLTHEFLNDYCLPDGSIDWKKLVEFSSGNYDLDNFIENV